ncbi:unnamed protein product [Brachionus calyciflorus]|uniref:Uncharacterized protein n=1 Tax=Brachionus calyciflorus TaxID=104777 RepID=A0A813SBU2_9BILA|nr:unnamed protein product [Brachionus calyciflorus]
MANFDDYETNVYESRKTMHIPISDVDDLPFKNRNDPQFIAKITNLMQVPTSITLDDRNRTKNMPTYIPDQYPFAMDIPEKLTADDILNGRPESASSPFVADESHDTTVTPPSTPTKGLTIEQQAEEIDNLSKTPQISAVLYQKMRPRRSSIEVDLHQEIRMLRDRLNYLENECQVNSRSCKLFYAILCGYVLLKTFSWLINK